MKEYIHYGNTEFNPELLKGDHNLFRWLKPCNVLWASPVDSELNWKIWCEENDFRECNDDNSFTFSLSENARVLNVNSRIMVDILPIIPGEVKAIDFNKIAKEYDAMYVSLTECPELYWSLYGWDCDSIAIFNPDVITNIIPKKIHTSI